MFPPPCFTVGMVFFGCNSAFFLLQTRQVEFLPKSYILVSSDHMTFSQSSSGRSFPALLPFGRSCYCSALCSLFLFFSQIFLRFLLQQISTVLKQHIFWKKRTFCLPLQQFTFRRPINTAVYIQTDERKCLLAARTATNFYKGLWFLKQSYLLDFQNRRNIQQTVTTDPLSIQPVSPVNLVI